MAESRFKPEAEEVEPAPDFELFVGDKGGEIINGDVPIRWCITKEYIQQLEEKGIIDPHVLIASFAPTNKDKDQNYYVEMDRKMVPLTELMTYLRFSRAGKAKIYAVILDGSGGRNELHINYMQKKRGEYNEIVSSWNDGLHTDLYASVKALSEFVEIPAGVFGKEPGPWMKWYVNLGHDTGRIVDECHYRRRWMIAFSIKWIPVIIWTLILIGGRFGTAFFLTICGYGKKVRILRSFRPWKYPCIKWNVITDSIDWVDDNAFIRKRACRSGNPYHSKTMPLFFGLAFTPLIFMLAAGITTLLEPNGAPAFMVLMAAIMSPVLGILVFLDMALLLGEFLYRHSMGQALAEALENIIRSKWFKYFIIIILGVAIVILWKFLLNLVGVLLIVGTVLVAIIGLVAIFSSQIMMWILNKITITAEENDYTNITELLCPKDDDNLRPNIKYIPKSRRTIRLWYLDVKNKMCKPMQQ